LVEGSPECKSWGEGGFRSELLFLGEKGDNGGSREKEGEYELNGAQLIDVRS